MFWLPILAPFVLFIAVVANSISTQGLYDLVSRRLPNHTQAFTFEIVNLKNDSLLNEEYIITSALGKILVQGNSLSALASGLHRYLTDVVHVDIWWYVGSRLDQTPMELPMLADQIVGKSIVPWRYHFNTVTFSYTTAFWNWDDWELQLDWMSLHGINLPLAWVGYEYILLNTLRSINLTDLEIIPFFSGPAFQAWNRFGNIQGSWGGDLPLDWIESQFELQKKIVARMIELGMTPVLPAFTGFVPRAITRVAPNSSIVISSQWAGFEIEYSNDTFLEPFDPLFNTLQKTFITLQKSAYGNVTSIYTLDQYNENNPYSGELDYLSSISSSTHASLTAADPSATWLMQGWLFYALSSFWTLPRISAYLTPIPTSSLLILDLYSEAKPQWQRTNAYFGKNWIWCQVHDFGGKMGIYGQIENITVNPIEALANSTGLVGFGLTMEGQEGNEIMYDLLLDQAWEGSPISTPTYFANWVTRRYAGNNSIPEELYAAWEMLRYTAYNNTNLVSYDAAVPKSRFTCSPTIDTSCNGYNPARSYPAGTMTKVLQQFFNASLVDPFLWENPVYKHDIIDISQQFLSDEFSTIYGNILSLYTLGENTTEAGTTLLSLLSTLDSILLASPHFSLSTWTSRAASLAALNDTDMADFYVYNAKNQITLWGPPGVIEATDDYASKAWGGLVGGYYAKRWKLWLGYLGSVDVAAYNDTAIQEELRIFGEWWVSDSDERVTDGAASRIEVLIGSLVGGL